MRQTFTRALLWCAELSRAWRRPRVWRSTQSEETTFMVGTSRSGFDTFVNVRVSRMVGSPTSHISSNLLTAELASDAVGHRRRADFYEDRRPCPGTPRTNHRAQAQGVGGRWRDFLGLWRQYLPSPHLCTAIRDGTRCGW